MRLLVDDTCELSDGIWLAPLPTSDARRIGVPQNSKDGCSVVLIAPNSDTGKNWISFEPESAVLLNVGTVDFSVFIRAPHPVPQSETVEPLEIAKPGYSAFESQCVKHLPGDLAARAVAILHALCSESADDLVADKTNRWVSRPDNYFTIKVQPQNRDLVITIRGRPDEYASKTIDLLPDQNGYTRFWVRRPNDVPEALRLVRAARQRGRLRRR